MNRRKFFGFISQIGAGLAAGLFGQEAFARISFSRTPNSQHKETYGTYGGYGNYGIYGVYGEHGAYGAYGTFGAYGTYGAYGQYGTYGEYGGYGLYGVYGGYGQYGTYGYHAENGIPFNCEVSKVKGKSKSKKIDYDSQTNR